MKTDVEELSPTRVKLSVEVPFDELKPSIDKAYREVARQVRIPGFRPGRVPPRIIDQRIGRAPVLEQAVNDAIPELYGKAVEESELFALGRPEVEITSLDDGKELVLHRRGRRPAQVRAARPGQHLGDHRQRHGDAGRRGGVPQQPA